MSAATWETNITNCPGYRYAHPGYKVLRHLEWKMHLQFVIRAPCGELVPRNVRAGIRKLAARVGDRASMILSISFAIVMTAAAALDPARAGQVEASMSPPSYGAGWHRENRWSGEYPNGFTMAANLTISIRTIPDPAAPKSESCLLKRGATYHVWNKSRVASDKLQFVSYTRIETYQLKADYKTQLLRESDHDQINLSFRSGDRWSFLVPLSEGMFLMKAGDTTYYASQDLIDNSERLGLSVDERAVQDEWLGLKCANGTAGWILLGEIKGTPAFAEPNVAGYGEARDKR